jgi:two-component system response regulator PilR (NtrC family)
MTDNYAILVVEDSDATRQYMERTLEAEGYEVIAASRFDEAARLIETVSFDVAFFDLRLGDRDNDGRRLLSQLQEVSPDVPGIIITADDTAQSAVDLLRRGAYDYVVKPVDADDLRRLALRGIELRTARRALSAAQDIRSRGEVEWDVGNMPRMLAIETLVNKFAPTNAGVLIQGESGTGKEVVARALHSRSKRADGPFVAINCSAVPEQLLESELFGHEKGSFTGAVATRRGLLELAHGGTLFLDEATTMSPEMQSKLLRALQEFTIRRVGGQKEIKVDVRVLAASNQNVLEQIGKGAFREDLYYRLAVVTIELPALRERAVDIPYFVQKFLKAFREEIGSTPTRASEPAMRALTVYRWPGNIRELRNVIERAVILSQGEEQIDLAHLPESVRAAELEELPVDAAPSTNGASNLPGDLPGNGLDMKDVLAAWERSLVEQALERTAGNQSGAARLLGLTRDELRYRVDKYSIPV